MSAFVSYRRLQLLFKIWPVSRLRRRLSQKLSRDAWTDLIFTINYIPAEGVEIRNSGKVNIKILKTGKIPLPRPAKNPSFHLVFTPLPPKRKKKSVSLGLFFVRILLLLCKQNDWFSISLDKFTCDLLVSTCLFLAFNQLKHCIKYEFWVELVHVTCTAL